jgi:phenylpyruvate tautomerase PptA (4-oxalocrotonate tautomerase family)
LPTCVRWAERGRLTVDHKKLIARGITTIHAECTGAPPAFVQTIFRDADAVSHFIDGEDASDTVWVYGHIREHREHREAEVRTAILQQISQLLVDVLGIDATLTWTYINALANTDMVEFSHTLPLPGTGNAVDSGQTKASTGSSPHAQRITWQHRVLTTSRIT